MKKKLFFFFLFISVFLNAVNIKFLSQKTNLIKLEINFDYNRNFDILPLNHSINEDYILFENIKIPFYKTNLIIPDFDSLQMTYEIYDIQYQKLFYEYSSFADTLRSIIPKSGVEMSEPFILRDYRGITLSFFPFHLNSQNEWKIITKLSVTIESKSPFGKNPLKFHHNDIPFYFDTIYMNFFANYPNFKKDNIISEKMMLIVPKAWEDLSSKYATIKINEGTACEIYSYPEDTGISSNEIKNFILNKYEKNPALTFVTLIGDETFIPTIQDSLQNDNQYSFLEGDDSFPEIILGRLYYHNGIDFSNNLNDTKLKKSNKILFAGYLQNQPNEDIHTDIFPKQTDYKEIFCNAYSYQSINDLMISPQALYFVDGFTEFNANQYRFDEIYSLNFFKMFKNTLYKKNDFLFYSQIYMLFSLFHNSSPFVNLQDESQKIILDNDEICDINYKIESYQPFMVSVRATKNYKPLKNSEIFLISDCNIIASEYSNDFGSVDFSLNSFNESFVRIGSYNKGCGFNYDFISTKEPVIVSDTIGVSIKCFPNPFYPDRMNKSIVTIDYEMKKREFVSISIYNIIGQMVKTIFADMQTLGKYTTEWDGKDSNGRFVTSGIYYVMIKTKNNTETAKILLIK